MNNSEFLVSTPEGTRDRLWDDCSAQRKIELTLTALFAEHDYREVSTPVLEYYELYQQARNPIAVDSMIKLVGRDGKLLVLRPDCTTPIARIVATRLEAIPQRLYYCQNVFRLAANARGENCETAQCGVELFGIPGHEGNIEIVNLAIDALCSVGVDEFYLEVGGLSLAEFEKICNELSEDRARHVRFEPDLHQEIEYYTGLVFRAYANGAGKAVLAGGRYDKLTGDFGRDVPAVGFAVYVDELLHIHSASERSTRLKIAVTKGRLLEDTLSLFKRSGLEEPEALSDKSDRRLVFDVPNSNISLVLAKPADVITYVEHGVCELGIVGLDTLLEQGGAFTELLDLGFGKCRFAMAGPVGTDISKVNAVASKYPNIARRYLTDKGRDADVIKIDGSVELAPLLGLSDVIIDLVQTGGTLKANGLEVLDEVCDISARLIANNAALRLRRDEIGTFVEKLDV